MKIISILLSCLIFLSCHSKKNTPSQWAGVNHKWLDSIKQSADSSYIKKYGTIKFVKAEYYLNRKAAIICQVMKDSADSVRQIIVSKNNKRSYFAEYYPNGQLVAHLSLDSFGQYQGPSKYYYQNGFIEREGDYKGSLKTGTWKNYNELGKLVSLNEYDSNGQVVKRMSKE